MWETIHLVQDDDPGSPPWQLKQLEQHNRPGRFLGRREIGYEIMRDRDLADVEGFGYGMHPSVVSGVLDWLGRHGVNPDQLVARDAVR